MITSNSTIRWAEILLGLIIFLILLWAFTSFTVFEDGSFRLILSGCIFPHMGCTP